MKHNRWAFMKWVKYADFWRLHLLKTPWGAINVHVIDHADDSFPHDHPCAFFSILLWGTYLEHRPRERVIHNVRWFNFIRPTDVHRIISLNGYRKVVTLVFAGPVVREWNYIGG